LFLEQTKVDHIRRREEPINCHIIDCSNSHRRPSTNSICTSYKSYACNQSFSQQEPCTVGTY